MPDNYFVAGDAGFAGVTGADGAAGVAVADSPDLDSDLVSDLDSLVEVAEVSVDLVPDALPDADVLLEFALSVL